MTKRSNFPARKEARREAAAIRQAEYDALTLDEKLDRAFKINPKSRESERLSFQKAAEREAQKESAA